MEKIITVGIIIIIGLLLILIAYSLYRINMNNYIKGKVVKKVFFSFDQITITLGIITLLGVFGFLIIDQRINHSGDISPGKASEEAIIQGVYDKTIAFGQLLSFEDIQSISIINNFDVSRLMNLEKKYHYKLYYNVYLVQKDNLDYVYVVNLSKPYESYLFESNLPYSFDELLEGLEAKLNKKVEELFLNNNNSGIRLQIIKHLENINGPQKTLVYTMKYEGNYYFIYYYINKFIILDQSEVVQS